MDSSGAHYRDTSLHPVILVVLTAAVKELVDIIGV
jgi:hypothetical protein